MKERVTLEVQSAQSVLRFEPRTSDSKMKTIPLHKSVEESLPILHSSPFWREETCGVIPSTNAVACTQSCSIKQAYNDTTDDTIVCDEIFIHTNCSMDSFSTSSWSIEVPNQFRDSNPRTSNPNLKTIPLYKRVSPRSAEEPPPSLHIGATCLHRIRLVTL